MLNRLRNFTKISTNFTRLNKLAYSTIPNKGAYRDNMTGEITALPDIDVCFRNILFFTLY